MQGVTSPNPPSPNMTSRPTLSISNLKASPDLEPILSRAVCEYFPMGTCGLRCHQRARRPKDMANITLQIVPTEAPTIMGVLLTAESHICVRLSIPSAEEMHLSYMARLYLLWCKSCMHTTKLNKKHPSAASVLKCICEGGISEICCNTKTCKKHVIKNEVSQFWPVRTWAGPS